MTKIIAVALMILLTINICTSTVNGDGKGTVKSSVSGLMGKSVEQIDDL